MILRSRTNIYQLVSVDNISERDINNSQWNLLNIQRPITYYRVSYGDIQRPDLISLKIYGKIDYWWILMCFNEIYDCWNDLTDGQILNCPDILDIEDYLSKIKSYS
jgi:hypothetical protein